MLVGTEDDFNELDESEMMSLVGWRLVGTEVDFSQLDVSLK